MSKRMKAGWAERDGFRYGQYFASGLKEPESNGPCMFLQLRSMKVLGGQKHPEAGQKSERLSLAGDVMVLTRNCDGGCSGCLRQHLHARPLYAHPVNHPWMLQRLSVAHFDATKEQESSNHIVR